jgi:two-component sensor histidine kinase
MLHTVSWRTEAAQPQAPVRVPLRFVRCRAGWARWLLAPAIWLTAAAARWLLDDAVVIVIGPFLTFLPAVAVITLFCGRWQAVLVIALAVATSAWLWLPPVDFFPVWPTTPASLVLFVFVALVEAVLIDSLYLGSRGNAAQQDWMESRLRLHEIMVREMRHRIANQLHLVTAMLEGSQGRIDGGAKVSDVLGQAARRVSSVTRLQRIVDDGMNHQRGLASLLRDILDHVFQDVDVAVQVRTAPVELADHHVTIICLIVIEAAMNSLKHTFRFRRGCMFAVELRRLDDGRLALKIWDDGPGFAAGGLPPGGEGLGFALMHNLAAELGGRMTSEDHCGSAVKVEFSGV